MIIGICGLASAGKDSIADFIIQDNPDFVKIKMAHHLKDVCSLLFGMDRKMLEGETIEDRIKREEVDSFWNERVLEDLQPFTPRKALQYVGTNLLRNQLCQNIWVSCLEKKIKDNNLQNVIVPDIRFLNEIELIRKLGGIIIRVERGERPHWWDLAEEFNLSGLNVLNGKYIPLIDIHFSEREWIGVDNPDYIIKNNGTLEDLQIKVKEIFS